MLQRQGVGQPIVVDEAVAVAICCTRHVNNMDDIDGINRAMLEATKLIGKAISAWAMVPLPPPAGVAASADIGIHINSLYKRLKKAKEEDKSESAQRYERLILALKKEEEENTEAHLCLSLCPCSPLSAYEYISPLFLETT
jgi:hypothetical protein